MFDDDRFGLIFPVRTGQSIGTANERTMLDAIGGAAGFRTRVQNNPDGSTTILRTKNGMPQFTTTPTQRGELAERAYDERLRTLPIAPGVYIPGLSYTQRFTLTNTATLTVGTYPTTDASTADWTFTDITSLEGLTFANAVRTSKATYALTGDVVCAVSPTIINYSEPYTVVGDFTTGWTSARLNRAKYITLIGGPNQRVLLKTPNEYVDDSGISPFDTVTLFGKPWHGELKATGLQCTPEILREECIVSAATTRPDCSYVRFDAEEQIIEPTEAEAAYGISWRNYALLVGVEKKWRGGTLDSATIGELGWIYRDGIGRVWQFSFSHNIPTAFGTTAAYRCPYSSTTFVPTNHTVSVARKRFGTTDAPTSLGSITVPIGARLNPNAQEFPSIDGGGSAHVVMSGTPGTHGQFMVMQKPDGSAAVLNIRSTIDTGRSVVCAAVVEATITDNGDDPPTAGLAIVSGFADQRADFSSVSYQTYPRYGFVVHDDTEGTFPNVTYSLWGAVEQVSTQQGFPTPYEARIEILIYHTYTKAGARVPAWLKTYVRNLSSLNTGWTSQVYQKNFHENIPYETIPRYDGYEHNYDVYRTTDIVIGGESARVYSSTYKAVVTIYIYLVLGGYSPGAGITNDPTDSETAVTTDDRTPPSGFVNVRAVSNCVVAAYVSDSPPPLYVHNYTLTQAVSPYGSFSGSEDFGETATPLAVCVNPYDGSFQINPNNSWRGFI